MSKTIIFKRKWKFGPRRLVVQVPLLGAVLLSMAIGMHTWLLEKEQVSLVEAGLQLQGQAMVKNVAGVSKDYLLTGDFASLKRQLIGFVEYPLVLSVKVIDAEGQLLADAYHRENDLSAEAIQSSSITLPEMPDSGMEIRNGRMIHWHPVNLKSQLVWVRIEHNLQAIDKQQTTVWKNSLISSLLVIISAIMLLVISLRRPMKAIQEAAVFAKNLDGARGRQIPVYDTSIEIQGLNEALNYASTRLNETSKCLMDQKFALDQSSIVSVSDANGVLTYVNNSFCDISQYSREELLGLNQHFLSATEQPELFYQTILSCIAEGEIWRGEIMNRRKDGGCYWVSATIIPFMDDSRKPYQYISIQVDITERKQAESQMQKLSSALMQTADSVMITDKQSVIEFVNPGFEQMTGYGKDEALGNTPSLLKSGKQDSIFYQQLWETLANDEVYSGLFINRRKNGEIFYAEQTISPLKDEAGAVTHYISTSKDITARMDDHERLQYLAHYDVLTGLPNRALFLERLEHVLSRAQWSRRINAVFFIDLDRFKIINDTLGHDAGDRILQMSSDRLKGCIREGDTVARLGGDEFTILLEDMATRDDIPTMAQNISDVLARPFELDGRGLFVTCSIGISLFPDDGGSSAELLKNADTAMFKAKDAGRNNYQFYSSQMSEHALERLILETSLRYALEREEFLLYYQPQVDINTHEINGMEALLRWQQPEHGLISPAEFIPLLEETGLILPVGEWVLRTACTQARAWQASGYNAFPIAVNLSSRQFALPGLAASIQSILEQTGLAPDYLELEITESVIMQDEKVTINTLNTLNEMGISLSIDDFGTGYSSLSYLKRFPVETLKVDQSFVRDIADDPDDAQLIRAIISLGKSLNLKVIAEGVETEEQLNFLHSCGCHSMQGYLFSRPLPAKEITRLLRNQCTEVKKSLIS